MRSPPASTTPGSASRRVLNEEQRAQIIGKLLEERKQRKGGDAAAGCPARQEDARAARVAALLQQQRAQQHAQQQQQQQQQQQPAQQQHVPLLQPEDHLLSPGSTCSLASNPTSARLDWQQQAHQQPQQQQRLSSAGGGGGVLSARSSLVARLMRSPRQQQQQHQQQLSSVLDGPVDISDLWGAPGSARASLVGTAASCDTLDEDEEPPRAQLRPRHRHTSGQLTRSSAAGSDSDSEGQSEPGDSASCTSLQEEGKCLTTQEQLARRRQQLLELHEQLARQRLRQQPPAMQQQQQQQQLQQAQRHGQRQRQQQQQQPQQQQPQQQQQQQAAALPRDYPASRDERIQQLAQPRSANRHKYEQMKLAAEQEVLQHCSFAPKTGRGPQHHVAPAHLPACDRLYAAAAERAARLERKKAEQAGEGVEDCTFRPRTNAAANDRHLASYEYVPLHQRLGQVMRSRSEKLAAIQQAVEAEQGGDTTFAPRINPRSSLLAVRRSRSHSRQDGDGPRSRSPSPSPLRAPSPARAVQHGAPASPRSSCALSAHDSGRSQASRGGSQLRRTRSEADLAARLHAQPSGSATSGASEQACTFTPRINASSRALLRASGDIPAGFLQRQAYFDRLAREKKQLLQLAVEDQHCSFSPGTGTRCSSRSGDGGSLGDQESFLDRIERLAYSDKRRVDAARSALAQQVQHAECTFAPAINPRSARMAQATPLQELYENSRGRQRRAAVALALELQHESECSFRPNTSKPRAYAPSPPEAKLSLSASEVADVVSRLHGAAAAKEDKVEAALSFQQYQELRQCTFKPEITRHVPQQTGPVLVRGLGRFMELKGMARQQAEARVALEERVFLTRPKAPAAPFTVPQPFKLGRRTPSAAEARRCRAEAEAEAAATAECTFRPAINRAHKTRQQRVMQLLESTGGAP